MTPAVTRFADAATLFCDWCHSPPGDAEDDARSALRHLTTLYALAQALRELDNAPDVATTRSDDDAWRAIYTRFGALPFNHYASIFDPQQLDEAEVDTGDLADDLADIWRDLDEGLVAFTSGHTGAAEWQWAWSFRNHWGRHAASAIHALHCWFADQGAW